MAFRDPVDSVSSREHAVHREEHAREPFLHLRIGTRELAHDLVALRGVRRERDARTRLTRERVGRHDRAASVEELARRGRCARVVVALRLTGGDAEAAMQIREPQLELVAVQRRFQRARVPRRRHISAEEGRDEQQEHEQDSLSGPAARGRRIRQRRRRRHIVGLHRSMVRNLLARFRMTQTLPVRLVAQQEWLENLGEAVQPAVRQLLQNLGDGVVDLLQGKWLGHPVHPALTDVPVGAWTAALAMDAVELMSDSDGVSDAADLAVGVGVAGALAAAVTGIADWSEVDDEPARKIGVAHALLNVTAVGLYTTSLIMRRTGSRRAGIGVSLLGYAVASVSAYLGGHLVFGEGVGVESRE
ncbi:MAG: hypothetical protein DMF56_11530 [Acidobacteria bacterium]|nr:MAG: hypothetical protein DMF56_11530 [Acidobacteriota bacterium]